MNHHLFCHFCVIDFINEYIASLCLFLLLTIIFLLDFIEVPSSDKTACVNYKNLCQKYVSAVFALSIHDCRNRKFEKAEATKGDK
jgi:hypothetical protein